mgnify:CR=1 FL=1
MNRLLTSIFRDFCGGLGKRATEGGESEQEGGGRKESMKNIKEGNNSTNARECRFKYPV